MTEPDEIVAGPGETGWRHEFETLLHAFRTPGTNADFLVYTVVTSAISVTISISLSLDVSGSNNFNALWLLLFTPFWNTVFAFRYRAYACWRLRRKERARVRAAHRSGWRHRRGEPGSGGGCDGGVAGIEEADDA